MTRCTVWAGVAILSAFGGTRPIAAEPRALSERQELARAIFAELIETDTTHSTGDTTRAADAMAKRLRAAGFAAADVQVLGPTPTKGNLVVRLRGSGHEKPILLLAHLDVVEAKPEDWSIPPFIFLERDGYFYGRGTQDDKAMAAIFVANLIGMKQDGVVPQRDIILALTADEESGPDNGVDWLLRTHRDLLDAAFVINEGGGGRSREGTYLFNGVQASEKTYANFQLEAHDKGGHSSLPTKANPIYRVARALDRLERYEFPVELSEVTRAYFARMANIEKGPLAADMATIARDSTDKAAAQRLSEVPVHNAMLRTTCTPTRLAGGHADNALPQSASALINCRILPGQTPADVQRTLAQVIADEQVEIRPAEAPVAGPASALDPKLMQAVTDVTDAMWPGVPVMPLMSTGASDSRYFRIAGIPAYGISGIFVDVDDVRAHGRDERLGVKQFYDGQEFLDRLVRKLVGVDQ
jgi:acetylornithine deacetylase/succinyl-diaminopimelate desuccinylase-like protein